MSHTEMHFFHNVYMKNGTILHKYTFLTYKTVWDNLIN
jgi:hypothetical protein